MESHWNWPNLFSLAKHCDFPANPWAIDHWQRCVKQCPCDGIRIGLELTQQYRDLARSILVNLGWVKCWPGVFLMPYLAKGWSLFADSRRWMTNDIAQGKTLESWPVCLASGPYVLQQYMQKRPQGCCGGQQIVIYSCACPNYVSPPNQILIWQQEILKFNSSTGKSRPLDHNSTPYPYAV